MTALDVLSVDQAKLHLNISLTVTKDDAELEGFIPAAVERVDRHLFTAAERAAGRSLATGEEPVTASRLLAVKVVLAEYWRTQRARSPRAGVGTMSAAAVDTDSGPAGVASLTSRLRELLGDPAASAGSSAPPVGSFPTAEPWPDPVRVRR